MNILWLVLSQWRADQTSAGQHPHVRVEAFERFADSGVRVLGAVANHPFPHPSKASFLTGLSAEHTGVTGASGPLHGDVETIAHRLARAGYATAHIGKWQLGRRDPELPLVGEASARKLVPAPERGGFAHWWGWDGGFLNEDPWVHGTGQETPTKLLGFQAGVLAARAMQLIEELPEPWFLCVHADAPHPPWSRASLARAAELARGFSIPADVPEDAELEARVRREFAASCLDLERACGAYGRLLERLDARGLRERTVAAWFANHGDQHGSGGHLRKGWPHAASVRVPCALRAPAIPRGLIAASGTFGLVDLLPTCFALAGLQVPQNLPGLDQSTELITGKPLTRTQPISLPEAPGLPMQCPFAWNGTASESGLVWTSYAGQTKTEPWAFPGWR